MKYLYRIECETFLKDGAFCGQWAPQNRKFDILTLFSTRNLFLQSKLVNMVVKIATNKLWDNY